MVGRLQLIFGLGSVAVMLIWYAANQACPKGDRVVVYCTEYSLFSEENFRFIRLYQVSRKLNSAHHQFKIFVANPKFLDRIEALEQSKADVQTIVYRPDNFFGTEQVEIRRLDQEKAVVLFSANVVNLEKSTKEALRKESAPPLEKGK